MTLTTTFLQPAGANVKILLSLGTRVFLVDHVFRCGGEYAEEVKQKIVEMCPRISRTSQHNASADRQVRETRSVADAEIRQTTSVRRGQSTEHL
jgi:hypothetical protein